VLLDSIRDIWTMAVSRRDLPEDELGEDGVEAAVDFRDTDDTSEHTEASELIFVMLIILDGLDMAVKTGAGGNGNAVDLGLVETGDMVNVEVGSEDTTEVGLVDFTSADSVLVSLNDALV
jgi:hypothetical protein